MGLITKINLSCSLSTVTALRDISMTEIIRYRGQTLTESCFKK